MRRLPNRQPTLVLPLLCVLRGRSTRTAAARAATGHGSFRERCCVVLLNYKNISSRDPSILTRRTRKIQGSGFVGRACLLLFVGYFRGSTTSASDDALKLSGADGFILFGEHLIESFVAGSRLAFDASQERSFGKCRVGSLDDFGTELWILLHVEGGAPYLVGIFIGCVGTRMATGLRIATEKNIVRARSRQNLERPQSLGTQHVSKRTVYELCGPSDIF